MLEQKFIKSISLCLALGLTTLALANEVETSSNKKLNISAIAPTNSSNANETANTKKSSSNITLPQGYILKTPLNDHTFLYANGTTEVLVLLHLLPTDEKTKQELSLEEITAKQTKDLSCTPAKTSNIGLTNICQKGNTKWVTFYQQGASRVTIQASSNNLHVPTNVIARLSKLSLAIYFYSLHIARNEEDIAYISKLLAPFMAKPSKK